MVSKERVGRKVLAIVLIGTLARSRPAGELDDPACAVKVALRRLARRHQQLDEEIEDADNGIRPLVTEAVPRPVTPTGVGPESAQDSS